MQDILGRAYKLSKKPPLKKKHGDAQVVAMFNQKGGVGKTTSTISLASAFASFGRKVLVVDLDPQGALSTGFGINAFALDSTIYTLFCNINVDKEELLKMTKETIVKTEFNNIDIIPADIDLCSADLRLVNELSRETVLKRILEPLKADYDIILLDCLPSLGLLAINGLVASDGILVPVTAEYLGLRATLLLVDSVSGIKNTLNPSLDIYGIFATLVDTRTRHTMEGLKQLEDAWKEKFFHTIITRTVKLPDSTLAAQPINIFDPKSRPSIQYQNLAIELIDAKIIK